jgi:hypothetical protein
MLLTRYGISVNNDSVLRSVYYKYLHPKEVFVAEGVLVPDIPRKKVSESFFNYSLILTICFHIGLEYYHLGGFPSKSIIRYIREFNRKK